MLKIVFMIAVIGSFVCVRAQTKRQVECVRSVPSPILNKKSFPQKTFQITKGQENPAEQIGFEKVKLSKSTKLTIINRGCEYYTLIFRFETGGFTHNLEDEDFWFNKAVALMDEVTKGIRSADLSLISRGTKALRMLIVNKRQLKFDD